MRNYKAHAICLHTVKYGDRSVVAYLLTDTLGRQSYMVQGVRSAKGKGNKGALLQPMFPLELEGYEAPRAQMHRIREMRAAPALQSVPFDVRKSTVALFMAEMLYRLVREVEPNSPLFEFARGAIVALDGLSEAGAVANFHLWFMVALSRWLGIFPGNEWSEGAWFDYREGLFTAVEPMHGWAFSRDNSAVLGVLMAIDGGGFAGEPAGGFADELAAVALNRGRRTEFLNAMLAYFGYHLNATSDVRSVEILREVF